MPKKNLRTYEDESNFQQIIGWKPPVLHQASECYVSFAAFDPSVGKMRLKKIMLGHIKGKRQQRVYGMELIKRLTQKLLEGWNPWVEETRPEEYVRFNEVCKKYEKYLSQLVKEGGIKPGSVRNYKYKLNFLKKWITEKGINVTYTYQFNKQVVGKFLDYVFVERNNNLRTRNNYIGWLKSFVKYLVSREYITKDPTQGIQLTTKVGEKNREVIPDNVLKRIRLHLEAENKHFLLACYILHYLFIRPHEMTHIKIKDLSEEKETILLSHVYTKNGRDAAITIPDHVMSLLKELKVFSYPPNYYLFGKMFRPGIRPIRPQKFREYWTTKVRKPLRLQETYKFYSLKDTGITNMIKANTDLLSVRDQARHSSVIVTNAYTPQENKKANPLIIGYEGVF